MFTCRVLVGSVLVCWAFSLASTVLAEEASTPQLAQDVLRTYNRDGYPIIYSSDLVGPDLSVALPSEIRDPIARLNAALASVGLALKPFEASQSWLVVRLQPRDQPARTDAREVSTRVREPVIEEIVVTSSRHVLRRYDAVSRHGFDADELAALPTLGDDAVRAVNHVPGVASLGVSAQPHIRGGARDEMLVVFNGVELLEPFHLKDFESLFSSFNPALIERIDVYTGGFPARYGDRMSGVMDIRPADDFPPIGGELGVSLLTSALAVYGTKRDHRWALSARRGNLDLLTRTVNPDLGTPSYADWLGHFSVALGENTRLDGGALLYQDDVELKDLEASAGERAESEHANFYLWGKIDTQVSNALSVTGTLSLTRVRHTRGGFSLDDAADETVGRVYDRWRIEVYGASLAAHHELASGHRMEYGVRLAYQKGRYRYTGEAELGDLALLVGSTPLIARQIDARINGYNAGAYWSFGSSPGARLRWDIGARVDYQDYVRDKSLHFSPRLSAAFELSERSTATLAAGRYYQAEGFTELQIEDGHTMFQKAQHTDQIVAGFEHRFPHPAWRVKVEAFAKRVKDPKRRYENLFNRLVLLPEIKPDRVAVTPSRAYTRGVELSLSYNPSPDLNVWASYSGGRAVDRVDGTTRRRSWDQRHGLSAGMVWNREPYNFSAVATWHSGWTTTGLPETFERLEPVDLRANADELPDFLSLDVRASRVWERPSGSIAAFVEITNAFGRNNIGGHKHELEFSDQQQHYMRVTSERTLLPLVPSVGFVWKFQ